MFAASWSPSKDTHNDGFVDASDCNVVDAHVSLKSDIYDAPRRSLRQLGLQPVESGFPYYSPAKPRSSASKLRDEECSVSSNSSSKADNSVKGGDGSERERVESSMSIDECSNSSLQQNVQQPFLRNGSSSSTGSQDLVPRLTNENVRRQIIRPWEDKLLASMDEQQLSGYLTKTKSSTPERTSENCLRNEILTNLDLESSKKNSQGNNSIQTAAEALVYMATPNKQQQPSLVRQDDDDSHVRVKENMPNGRLRSNNLSLNCSVMVDRDLGRVCSRKGASPQPYQVVIDCGGLVKLYERVVKDTEECSIEKMEQLHATFEQLVFRHRMCWEREALFMVCVCRLMAS